MSAFHNALWNVVRVPMFEVYIDCTGPDKVYGGTCSRTHREDDPLACPTKWDAIKNAKEDGWTWDKDGNWLCPECNKEGGEE